MLTVWGGGKVLAAVVVKYFARGVICKGTGKKKQIRNNVNRERCKEKDQIGLSMFPTLFRSSCDIPDKLFHRSGVFYPPDNAYVVLEPVGKDRAVRL